MTNIDILRDAKKIVLHAINKKWAKRAEVKLDGVHSRKHPELSGLPKLEYLAKLKKKLRDAKKIAK